MYKMHTETCAEDLILSKRSYLEVREICETNLDVMINKTTVKITSLAFYDQTYEHLHLITWQCSLPLCSLEANNVQHITKLCLTVLWSY